MAASNHSSYKALKTTQWGIGISISLVMIKGLAGHFGHSYALVADAVETGADILSSSLLWIGLKIALKPPDSEHAYGHGKAEPLAALGVALFLMLAAVWIAWHAIGFLTTPHEMPRLYTIPVLLLVIGVKEGMYRYVLKVGKALNSQAVKADAFHHRSDAITSLAALVGVAIALIAGKGYEGADDWAALLASGIIFYNAFRLLNPALAEIMDTAPPEAVVRKVRLIAGEADGVKEIEKCHVRKMGFEYFVDLHVKVNGLLTVTEGHDIAHQVKDRLLKAGLKIKDVLIHVEPAENPV